MYGDLLSITEIRAWQMPLFLMGKVLLSCGKREAASLIVIQIQEICREQKVWASRSCSFSIGEGKVGRSEAQAALATERVRGQPGLHERK